MDEQTVKSGFQKHFGGIDCLDGQTLTGLPEDGVLESALIFDLDKDIGLTKREIEILRLIVSGQTNKQIAAQLSRSERTVEFHRNRLMRKIGARNAAQLVKSALAMDLV
jgi:DNA-binding CsgD family transcriptional regulator